MPIAVVRPVVFVILAACAGPGPDVRSPGAPVDRPPAVTSSSPPSSSAGPSTVETSPPGAPGGPAFYDAGRVHSPVSASVVAGLAAWASDPSKQADLFLKAGASSTVSRNTLYCFADGPVDLDVHDALGPTLDFFLGGDAEGTTPFDRDTLAALSGKTAAWVIDGPLQDELAALSPQFALVHFGTNDMGMGSTHETALYPFHEAMESLVGILAEEGVVPVLFGISPRLDDPGADLWVPTYNAVIRGIAQQWQIPFVDLAFATRDLEDFGLSGDGLHLEAYDAGACLLTPEGLDHGYNVRNLIALEALDRVAFAVLDGAPSDDSAPSVVGDGGPDDPYVLHTLPFAHAGDTHASPWSLVDVWPCDDADESGPELTYTLTITEPTDLRFLLLDEGDVDVDLHLLDVSGACVARAHQMLEVDLDPGTWTVVVDSWRDGDGVSREGPYLFVAVPL